MLSGPVFLTPKELLSRAPLGAIPRSDIPGKPYGGAFGTTVHVGTSTGTVEFIGYPVDASTIVAKVSTGGDLGVARFVFSTDGGATFGTPQIAESNDNLGTRWVYEIDYPGEGSSGVSVLVTGSLTSPSFVTNDTWTVTTTASLMLARMCGSLSDLWRKYAMRVGQGITAIDEADLTMIAQLGRYWLTSGRGDVPQVWIDLGKQAEARFLLEAKGDLKINTVPDEDGFVFADYQTARTPFKEGMWRH